MLLLLALLIASVVFLAIYKSEVLYPTSHPPKLSLAPPMDLAGLDLGLIAWKQSECFLIATGEVKISRFTPDGRELILEHVGEGSLFGESEILLGSESLSSVLIG